ncbi:MAG: nucleoside/nucleotide kinase family protein [Actinomycetota bacterium]
MRDALSQVLDQLPPIPDRERVIVALAGPPAAGKSTFAEALAGELGEPATVVGLDGFHFDDAVLEARGDRARKGAPHTFDVAGYQSLLDRLRAETAQPVAVPVFDRTLELSRGSARIVETEQRIVLTEGNWLLLDEPPWLQLRPLFDLTVWLDVSLPTVERRIIDRWTAHGFERDEAERRARDNDLPNARYAIEHSSAADLTIRP